jgi:phage host-nuclease inhibitor protein Gam
MSVVQDTRQLIQDFLAPELRAISARLDAIEARLSANESQRATDKQDILHAIAQLGDIMNIQERLESAPPQAAHQ